MTRFAPQRWADGWPANVWAMTTVEDQVWADARIPHLMRVPAVVRGLSMEPLLGPVKLPADFLALGQKAWIITGGESGAGARAAHTNWYRTLRDQALASDIPFHFKQWGEWYNVYRKISDQNYPLPYPNGTRIHRFEDGSLAVHIGKKAAGRILDGLTWDEVPGFTGAL